MDRVEKQITQIVAGYIAKNGIQAPLETLPQLTAGYAAEVITRLDFKAHGITSLIWAIGYVYDFGWIHLPILDEEGFPIQDRGVTAFRGLDFLGLPWQTNRASSIFRGTGSEAAHIADQLPPLRG